VVQSLKSARLLLRSLPRKRPLSSNRKPALNGKPWRI
jgi:hypothetical protein